MNYFLPSKTMSDSDSDVNNGASTSQSAKVARKKPKNRKQLIYECLNYYYFHLFCMFLLTYA